MTHSHLIAYVKGNTSHVSKVTLLNVTVFSPNPYSPSLLVIFFC